MFLTYNHPGSSSFAFVHYEGKNGRIAAEAWWKRVHNSHGPCAPGGSACLSNRDAAKVRYRDGRRVFDGPYVRDPTTGLSHRATYANSGG